MSSANIIEMVLLLVLAVACVGQGRDTGVTGGNETQTMERKADQAPGTEWGRHAPGEVLVRFRDGTDEQTIARIQQEAHLETIKVVSTPNLYLMKIVDQTSVEETVRRLQRYGEVIFAEPNYMRRIQ